MKTTTFTCAKCGRGAKNRRGSLCGSCHDILIPLYKPDAALEAAKEREMARLTRQHCERTLATPRKVADGFDVSMFEELPNMQGDQIQLF